MRFGLTGTLLTSALLALGCGSVDNRAEDEDDRRDKAKPLPLNKVFTDSLSYKGDDRNDWKIFYVEDPGLLKVTVHFDKPDAGCVVLLKDKYGAEMAKEVQSANPRMELVRRVEPARFFVNLVAPDGQCASQYSIEAKIDPD